MRASRINRISSLVGSRRYLEVGVFQGQTFDAVDSPFKVAVDPAFQFDHLAKQTDSVRYHQQTSDDFFVTADYEAFDFIYLDGLHTFEQTLRDFLWSQKFAHRRTVWLIDDTVPNDAFSALPDPARCWRLRQTVGSVDSSWMGDVYKVIYFIREFMPQFAVRTFHGHGQTAVWPSPRPAFTPAFNSVAKVAALDYVDFLESGPTAMAYANDEDIYQAILKDIGPRP